MKRERGATAVLVALLMIPLLGAAAIAIDVGALYAERGKLQNGADAAALDVALNCAVDACSEAEAARYANANDVHDDAASVSDVSFSTLNGNDIVTVSTQTLTAGGASEIEHPFAQFIGVDASTVGARASAEWSGISGGTTWPFSVSACDFDPSMIGDGRHYTIRFDTEPTGPNAVTCERNGHVIPGGFGWLPTVGGECRAISSTEEGAEVQHGNGTAPTECRSAIVSRDLLGATVYLPVHSTELRHGVYAVDYYVAFTITGWKFSGRPADYEVIDTSALPANPPCPATGNDCRFLQGEFVRMATQDPGMEGGGPNQGATTVKLVMTPGELADLTG